VSRNSFVAETAGIRTNLQAGFSAPNRVTFDSSGAYGSPVIRSW